MNKNILEMKDSILNTWPDECFFFSIVQNCSTGYDWIMNNIVQIFMYKEENYGGLLSFSPSCKHHILLNHFDFCPYISKYCIPRELMGNLSVSFSDTVISAINSDFYVSTLLSQFFRSPNDPSFQDAVHANYIYGYDKESKIFYVADNFNNGKFALRNITIKDIDKAFNLVKNKRFDDDGNNVICFYKLKEHQHYFNKELLLNNLKEYMKIIKYNADKYNLEEEKYTFGIDCYDIVLKRFDYTNDFIELRNFAFLVDNCKLMVKRIQYLLDKEQEPELTSILESANDQVKLARLVLKYCIRYNLIKSNNIIEIIKANLLRLFAQDRELTLALIRYLEN